MKGLNRFTRFVAGISLIIVSVAVIVGMFKFGGIAAFYFTYHWTLSNLTAIDNPQFRQVAAVFLALLVYFGIYQGIYKRSKDWSIVTLSLFLILSSSLVYFAQKDRYFSIDGKPLAYYSMNPVTGEIVPSSSPGHDCFGSEKRPMSQEIVKKITLQESQKGGSNHEIPFREIKVFFNMETQEPLAYCYCDANGRYHFFLHDGYDPLTGRILMPVSPIVIEKAIGQNRPKPRPEKQDIKRQTIAYTIKFFNPDGTYYHGYATIIADDGDEIFSFHVHGPIVRMGKGATPGMKGFKFVLPGCIEIPRRIYNVQNGIVIYVTVPSEAKYDKTGWIVGIVFFSILTLLFFLILIGDDYGGHKDGEKIFYLVRHLITFAVSLGLLILSIEAYVNHGCIPIWGKEL